MIHLILTTARQMVLVITSAIQMGKGKLLKVCAILSFNEQFSDDILIGDRAAICTQTLFSGVFFFFNLFLAVSLLLHVGFP